MNPFLWLLKVILSHLLTDFVLQPSSWIKDRKKHHFASSRLYLHGLVTGTAVWIFLGSRYWASVAVIMVTHTIIDGWKSYRKETLFFFLMDQFFHLIVIVACWYFTFYDWNMLTELVQRVNSDRQFWQITTAVIFLTTPCGILIGKLTSRWRDKIEENTESLANAGKWIGMTERLIVFALVLQNQYAAIGLLVTAKGIIRFGEKERPEIKTEYLVIGTLLSIGIALATGLLTKI
jgi:hypothetical protein